jgi:CBS domain-containing protein
MSTIPSAPAERLATPIRDVMRPGAITVPDDASLLEAKRAMVRHNVHAVLIVSSSSGRPLGWVSDRGLLEWLERDLSSIPAANAITEPPRYVEPDAPAREAIEALATPGVTHLLVSPVAGGAPHGVVSAMDLVDLVTHPG